MKFKLLILSFLFFSMAYGQGKFFGGNNDGFATATITNVVLPLKIISFFVSEDNNNIKAYLTIASTEAVCGLQLERGSGMNDFKAVDSILITFPGTTASVFHFNDLLNQEGVFLYRIKIMQCDGSILYSSILTVKKNGSYYTFYYSPTRKTIYYTSQEKGKMEILGTAGQLIFQADIKAGSGIVSLPSVSSGIYLLRFRNKFVRKILIHE